MDVISDEDFDQAFHHFNRDLGYQHSKKYKEGKMFKGVISTKEREMRMRENLQSRDGPTAEIHDQVTWKIYKTTGKSFIKNSTVLQRPQTAACPFPGPCSYANREKQPWKSDLLVEISSIHLRVLFLLLCNSYRSNRGIRASEDFITNSKVRRQHLRSAFYNFPGAALLDTFCWLGSCKWRGCLQDQLGDFSSPVFQSFRWKLAVSTP